MNGWIIASVICFSFFFFGLAIAPKDPEKWIEEHEKKRK